MNNIFYNIVSFIIGIFLVVVPVVKIVKKDFKKIDIVMLVFAPLFLGLGVGSFFVPEAYQMIPIFVMLGLTLALIVIFIIYDRMLIKANKEKQEAKQREKEERKNNKN